MNIKIGNTPMLKIKYRYNNQEKFIYSKLEFYNLTGSIKDRVVYYIIKKAYEDGSLKKKWKLLKQLVEILEFL